MKFYRNDDTNSLNIVQPITSASTLIGSLTSQVKDFVLSRFPKDLFKSVYIDTAESANEQKRKEQYNQDANKIPYPSMVITPEITLEDPIGGMEKHLHLSSPNLYLRKDLRGTYKSLVMDPKQNVSIYYTSDYITTNFNFKIITNSFIQNTDLAYFLKSRFQAGTFQFLDNRYVQSEVPKTFIRIIADMLHLDINEPYEMDQLRLYLIGTGLQDGMIEKKVNLSTGKQCFFINERVNFLILFDNLDCPTSIIREGQSEGEYTITFRVQVSAYLPNAFIMNISKKTLMDINCQIDTTAIEQEEGFLSSSNTIGIDIEKNSKITTKNETTYFKDTTGVENIGQLIYNDIFTYSINKPIPKISLMDFMSREFKEVHEYAVNGMVKPINLSQLIYIYVSNKDGELNSLYYRLDLEKMTIDISKNIQTDISVAVYINRSLFETLKISRSKDKFYLNDGALTSMFINDGTNNKICIYYLDDKYDMNNCLRIQTVYGPGYITLKNNSKTDGYKICTGFKNGNPIIKKFNTK